MLTPNERAVWAATESAIAEQYAWPERCGEPFLPKELTDDNHPDLGPRLWQVVIEVEAPKEHLRPPRRNVGEDEGAVHLRV